MRTTSRLDGMPVRDARAGRPERIDGARARRESRTRADRRDRRAGRSRGRTVRGAPRAGRAPAGRQCPWAPAARRARAPILDRARVSPTTFRSVSASVPGAGGMTRCGDAPWACGAHPTSWTGRGSSRRCRSPSSGVARPPPRRRAPDDPPVVRPDHRVVGVRRSDCRLPVAPSVRGFRLAEITAPASRSRRTGPSSSGW